MKTITFAIGIIAAGLAQAAAPPLPPGTYVGTASWQGPQGSKGTYTVERTFEGGSMTSRYAWTQPKPREETHTMKLAMKASEPFFEVRDEKDQVVGRGYCYDEACSYHATIGPVTVDETFRWGDGYMEVIGAKSGPGFSVVWKEALKPKADR